MAQDPNRAPTERALSAARRAAELEERLRRLEAGEPPNLDDVDRAEQAASDEVERSAAAHLRSAATHVRAASAHRSAADLMESTGQAAQATQHRKEAQFHDREARRNEVAARDEPSDNSLSPVEAPQRHPGDD